MYTILVRMLNDHENAADALQEAFVKVFLGLNNFRKQSTLGAWIRTIVIREGLSRQQNPTRFEPMNNEALTQPITWDTNLTGEYLEKAIANLPEGYRNIFLLIEVEGYTHRETADILGISEGTSKSQLHQAKKKLQKSLGTLMN